MYLHKNFKSIISNILDISYMKRFKISEMIGLFYMEVFGKEMF